MAYDSLELSPEFTYETYQEQAPTVQTTATPSTTAVTSINGLGGPTVTLSGGTTGLSFSVASPNINLTGTLVAANGGTGQSTYTKGDLLAATGAAALGKLGVGANDSRLVADSTQATGLRWQAVSTGWTASTGTATRTAFDTATATVTEVAERLKALLDDLMTQKVLKA
jgi:hypothetical protein